LAERKQTSPEVLRDAVARSPIPSLLDYCHSPSAGSQRASRYHTPQGLATLGRISFTTALGTRARLRARAVPSGRRVARTRTPPTVTSRAAWQRDRSLSPTALEGLSPSALQHRPLSAIGRSLWLHADSLGGLSAATLRRRQKASRPTPPRSRPTG
jgi:hypothetical protein